MRPYPAQPSPSCRQALALFSAGLLAGEGNGSLRAGQGCELRMKATRLRFSRMRARLRPQPFDAAQQGVTSLLVGRFPGIE